MSHRRWIILGLLALWLLSPRRAVAEEMLGDSLEWLILTNDVVARCKPVDIVDDGEAGPRRWWRVAFDVTAGLKGGPPQRVTVRLDSNEVGEVRAWQVSGDERIAFFNRTDHEREGPVDTSPEAFGKYPLKLNNDWSCRMVMGTRGEAGRGGGKVRNQPVAITSDFKVLRNTAPIEAAVRSAIAAKATPAAPPPRVRAQWNVFRTSTTANPGGPYSIILPVQVGDVYLELWSGSGVSLRVPLDSRTEESALKWAGDPHMKHTAVAALCCFKSDRSIAVMKSWLDDKDWSAYGIGGPAMEWRYPVRELAYESLLAWGEKEVPRPPIELPGEGYKTVTRSDVTVVVCALVAGALILAAGIQRFRGGRASRTFATLVWLLPLLAAGVIAWAGWRSSKTALEMTGTFDNARLWATLADGKLTLSRASAWPFPARLSVAAFEKAAAPDQRWRLPSKGIANQYDRLGFTWASGTVEPVRWLSGANAAPPPAPYVALVVPMWAFVGAPLFVPATIAAAAARRSLRRRRRARHGECIACGYDLRGGHDRCPECGAAAGA